MKFDWKQRRNEEIRRWLGRRQEAQLVPRDWPAVDGRFKVYMSTDSEPFGPWEKDEAAAAVAW